MKGERLETRLSPTSQTQLQTMVRMLIIRNLRKFITKDRHFNASINRITNLIHLPQSNLHIPTAGRAVST